MKISVKAKTNAKIEKVEKLDDTHLIVSVKTAPIEGKANVEITQALAKYFGISKSRVKLLTGKASKNKIFEIL